MKDFLKPEDHLFYNRIFSDQTHQREDKKRGIVDYKIFGGLLKKLGFAIKVELDNRPHYLSKVSAKKFLYGDIAKAPISSKALIQAVEDYYNSKTPTIAFDFFIPNAQPFSEKLIALQERAQKNDDGSFSLIITGVPTTEKDKTAKLLLNFKKEYVIQNNTLLTQIKDERYRTLLLESAGSPHWTFEFFDLQKPPFQYPQELLQREQRARTADEKQMIQIEKQSIEDEQRKATIKGRFSSDGALGELKSVNIHSKQLNGQALMHIWDSLCQAFAPTTVYLEDDAKIEYPEQGSYNLRLFRYFTTDDKSSWYTDSYQYKNFTFSEEKKTIVDAPDTVRQKITQFKNRSLQSVLDDAKSIKDEADKKRLQPYLKALEKYLKMHPEAGLLSLEVNIKEIGKHAKDGKADPTTLHALLTGTLEIYAKTDAPSLKQLKEDALFILHNNCLRKQY